MKKATDMGSELAAYLSWVLAVAIMLLVPGILLWGVSRLLRRIEAGVLLAIFVGLLCVAAGTAIFYGLPAAKLLESPSTLFEQNYLFWLRVFGFLAVTTLLIYYVLGMGLWLRSFAAAVVFSVVMFFIVKGLHHMLLTLGAYKVASG